MFAGLYIINFSILALGQLMIIVRNSISHNQWEHKGIVFFGTEKSQAVKKELDSIMVKHFGEIPKEDNKKS